MYCPYCGRESIVRHGSFKGITSFECLDCMKKYGIVGGS